MSLTRNVLMLVENLSVPADPRVWKEAQVLHTHGFQVCIICPKGATRDQEAYACIDGIHIYRYRLWPANKASGYFQEYSIAMLMTFLLSLKVWYRHGFSVIHAANPPDTFFVIGAFYRLLGKAYVFDQHDVAPALFRVKFPGRMKLLHKVLLFLEHCSYRTAQLILTANESRRRIVIEHTGHSKNVCAVRSGPELARFTPVAPEPQLKQGWRYTLVYMGIMGAQDGVENALYALYELVHVRGRQDVCLILLGEGEQRESLEALAHTLRLDNYARFIGWVTGQEMLRYLAIADVCLSPEPSNEFNDQSTMLKVMEYMALGKPIVAFHLPETHFSAQDAALYATPNRIEEFADRIETLLDDDELRQRMGSSGRKRVEEELSWDRTQKQLLLAYEKLFPGSLPALHPTPIEMITIDAGFLRAKRILDVVFTLLMLPILCIVFVLIALLVRLSSKGPVVFRQRRVGKHGTEFDMFKFRSMYTHSESAVHQETVKRYMNGQKLQETSFAKNLPYKQTADPRITWFGRFIRRTSLDELPQFWNVLKGEMTLVGPRPPLPYEVELYYPRDWLRLSGKPGLTGYWQVHGRSRVTFQEMVEMDIAYLQRQLLWEDIKLIAFTIPVMVLGRGGA